MGNPSFSSRFLFFIFKLKTVFDITILVSTLTLHGLIVDLNWGFSTLRQRYVVLRFDFGALLPTACALSLGFFFIIYFTNFNYRIINIRNNVLPNFVFVERSEKKKC